MKISENKKLSNKDYHADKRFVSASDLKLIHKCPKLYKYRLDNPQEPTEAMIFGTAFHCFVLEPKNFEKNYSILDLDNRPEPDKTMASNKNKEWKAKLETKGIILTMEQFNDLIGMKQAMFENKVISDIFRQGYAETSLYWKDEEVDVDCKCRPDWINHSLRMVVDLKTTKSAEPEDFCKDAAKMGYHLQAAHYLAGCKDVFEHDYKFVFVAIEKKAPYLCSVFVTDLYADGRGETIEIGDTQRLAALKVYRDCSHSNNWLGYESKSTSKHGIFDLKLPNWYVNKVESKS